MRKVLLIEDDPTITDFMEVVGQKDIIVTIAHNRHGSFEMCLQEDSLDLIFARFRFARH